MVSFELKSKQNYVANVNANLDCVIVLNILTFHIDLFGKGCQKLVAMLPKSSPFFQLLVCLPLFKNKIPIINFTVAIKAIISVKMFLRNLPVTLCSLGLRL